MINLLHSSLILSGLETAIFGVTDVHDAKKAVDLAVNTYHWAITTLNVMIGTKLLEYNASEKKENILKWIFSEKYGTTQSTMNEERVIDSGAWFTESEEFKDWTDGDTSLLICSGIGLWPS